MHRMQILTMAAIAGCWVTLSSNASAEGLVIRPAVLHRVVSAPSHAAPTGPVLAPTENAATTESSDEEVASSSKVIDVMPASFHRGHFGHYGFGGGFYGGGYRYNNWYHTSFRRPYYYYGGYYPRVNYLYAPSYRSYYRGYGYGYYNPYSFYNTRYVYRGYGYSPSYYGGYNGYYAPSYYGGYGFSQPYYYSNFGYTNLGYANNLTNYSYSPSYSVVSAPYSGTLAYGYGGGGTCNIGGCGSSCGSCGCW